MKDANPKRYQQNKVWKLFSIIYVFISSVFAFIIFQEGNLVASTLFSKIGLISLCLLVFAPGFSLVGIIMYLRVQRLLQKRDVSEILLASDDSYENETIDSIIGNNGKKVLNMVVVFLIILLVIVFAWAIMQQPT